jgi:NRPS condensation-like uncharacterized protein
MDIPDRFQVTAQDAYNYAASKVFADQQLCIIIKLDGKLDEDVLANAIRLSMDFEPILGCRFVENGGNPYWLRRSDLDQIENFRAIETATMQKEVEAFVNDPIHADVDPLVATAILREKNGDTVCIKVNHSVCDGGGLKEYVSLLSDLYSMLVTCGRSSVQPNMGRRDQSLLFQRTKDPRTLAMKGFPKPTWTLLQKEGSEPLHSFRTISKPQFEAVKKYAHDKKATVNDVLLTALYRTLFAVNNTAEGKPMMVQVSIDLRRYLPKHMAEAICNLSGALYIAIERKTEETFEETLQRICLSMNELKQDYPGLESAAGLEYLFSQGFSYLEKYMAESAAQGKKYNVTFPLLSNFGILDKYRFGELEMLGGYITSPIIYPPGFMLGAATFNDEMTLSIGYCGKENIEQINRFLDAYLKELPNTQNQF